MQAPAATPCLNRGATSFKERSGGELDIKPFPAKSVAADNNALFEAVKTGVLQGMNAFTLYWAGKIPASVFLSSYPVGPDQPAQWDIMFDALGMKELAREIYSKARPVLCRPHSSRRQHHPLQEAGELGCRFPGYETACAGRHGGRGIPESFGASTVSLPGSDIFPALEKGTIDAADYVGPAVNWDLGFAQVTKYILFGPPGLMSIYQPVDLMEFTANAGAWKRLSPEMQKLVEEQVKVFSSQHYLGIQKRNVEALQKFKDAGSIVNRMSQDDVDQFRKKAIPIWFNWGKKSPDAARVLQLQLDFMLNDLMGYITPEDIKGYSL
jgi:TRAP-type mannitol/chloroaromatic compound transport system substrate-binding protein